MRSKRVTVWWNANYRFIACGCFQSGDSTHLTREKYSQQAALPVANATAGWQKGRYTLIDIEKKGREQIIADFIVGYLNKVFYMLPQLLLSLFRFVLLLKLLLSGVKTLYLLIMRSFHIFMSLILIFC
jgi:hypothetical protein